MTMTRWSGLGLFAPTRLAALDAAGRQALVLLEEAKDMAREVSAGDPTEPWRSYEEGHRRLKAALEGERVRDVLGDDIDTLGDRLTDFYVTLDKPADTASLERSLGRLEAIPTILKSLRVRLLYRITEGP